MSTADALGIEHRLATYGTLAPGGPNEHVLGGLEGAWTPGTVRGHLLQRGWGADAGYPGIVLDDSGPRVDVQVFTSRDLPAHWDDLDRFEGPGYLRRPALVHCDGADVMAYVYALADDATPPNS